ncbi:MAG: ATP synthase F1 subunit epsilon [Candidatus Woykebacteria bacterium RIFCSPHIGHO2_12_FULL_43_10]|uniref:ATP synthase epsilon chain n=2 Tax=Candidatus Woykeibacteriota TaxID=1817899 RepID=A0A1G1WWV7_9BACT|nr:MAG: ATP synthase F1 subunit epsilon [Candidatus Woykebacteria bacterium RIFCSPHIGHO2_01_FULL_43_29]OGY28932.1 MAG: ATP synthase F1 subunit epsilon [Candidatus Woykebacteria bacterium RIFCSPHIGHO2_12_FULL_43_10]OGY29941.1 MAG: ATP synthase F1 subunit epsilon [Candidatus Woykebacteria bacterium RIFCSPHIGHO2_02_FULL_43_16b]OGY32209.1 MAG: ATP synthase F1 subunit epsilon [Candidatus Woykebacteria bacterium RIFCSPLOWO2_01_FULL_43_14]
MAQFDCRIITPEKIIFDDSVQYVSISTSLGRIGILPHHADLMAKIVPGELSIEYGDDIIVLAIGEGFVNMHDGDLTVLTDLAKSPEEIDEDLIQAAHERAVQALQHKLSDEEYALTLGVIEKSVAQLKIKRRSVKN